MKLKLLLPLSFLLLVTSINIFGQTKQKHKKGKTDYVAGKVYKTTGKQYVKRSSAEKLAFLKRLGLKKTPSGYEIDHIIPLSQGGEDKVENMQLLTKGQHKIKTAIEKGEVANINNTKIKYSSFENNTLKPIGVRTKTEWSNQKNTSAANIDKELSSKKVLFNGKKGGTFYYNTNGKKTYVKKKTTKAPNTDITIKKEKSNKNTINKTTTNYSAPTSSTNNNSTSTTNNNTTKTSPTNGSVTVKGVERIIQTGSRGGQYYINSNGNKTYIKKN